MLRSARVRRAARGRSGRLCRSAQCRRTLSPDRARAVALHVGERLLAVLEASTVDVDTPALPLIAKRLARLLTGIRA